MKLKQYLLLFLAILLLLTSAGCKNGSSSGFEGEYEDGYVSLSDEEFYGEPELILRATVDVIKRQYATDPTDNPEQKIAEVTVYNLAISEVFKGNLGDEMPAIFYVKIYNTEEDPFYLTVGEEYILGISYLKETNDEYGDGGGYVIIGPRRWTFHLGTNGTEYLNYDQKGNSKKWESIQTLLDELEKLQQPDSEIQTVVEPMYTVDEIQKDPAITNAQREQFFEFVQEWRVDAMTDFTLNEPMQLELFKYYCAYFVEEDEKTYVDMGVNYTGAAIERIAKWFGTSYGLKDDEPVFLKAGSLRDLPLAELIEYKEKEVNGTTLVTARCIQYSFPEYYYVDWSDVPKMESYADHKRMILEGNVTSGYETYQVFDVSFYTEDGKTPTQFVAYNCYYPESFDKGFPLPDFIPGEKVQPEKEPTENTEPAPQKATVILAEDKTLERVGDRLFYYGIKEFYPVLDGKQEIELREIAKDDNLAGYRIFKQGKTDEENGLCEKYSCYSTGHHDPAYDYYEYPGYYVVNVSGLADSYYLICTPGTDCFALYNKMIMMNAPADSVIVPSTKGPVDLGKGVYFYTVQRFMPTLDGKQVDFEQLLREDPQAEEKLLKQADKDAAKSLCEKVIREDGTEYRYKEHTLFKIHALNLETDDPNDYHEALVIGRLRMNCDEIYAILFEGLRYI